MPAERKRKLEQEEEAQEITKLLSMTTFAFVVSDPRQPDNPLVYVNEGFTKMTGYTQAEAVGRNCRFLQGRRTEPNKVMQIRDAVREERPVTVLMVNYRKNGEEFRNLLHVAPHRAPSGTVLHYIGVQAEVPMDYELDEEALAAPEGVRKMGLVHESVVNGLRVADTLHSPAPSAQKNEIKSSLLLALNHIQQSFVLSDPRLPDNPIVHASKGFLDMSGYPLEEVLGRNCRFLQGAETAPEGPQALRQAVTSGTSCSTKLLNYRKDGTPFWNSIHISPIRNAQGEVMYFAGVQVATPATDVPSPSPASNSRPISEKMAHMSTVAAVKIAVRGVASNDLIKHAAK